MTTNRFFVPRLLSGTSSPRTLVTVLVAALALGFGPAAFAQEPEEEERTVRVMVLGDGPVEVLEERHLGPPPGSARSDNLTTRLFEMAVSAQGGAYLGVELVNLNEPLRTHFGVPAGSGVLVSNVVDDSPAARAGVQVGDILTRFDGEDVASSRKLTTMVRRAEAGDPADLEIWRDGKVETVSTTLDERPRPDLKAGSYSFSFRGKEDLDGDGEIDVFVAPEDVHTKIQEYFNGDEWKERHEHVQRFLHERRPDMKALEERLEALKTRLAELEGRLEDRRLDN